MALVYQNDIKVESLVDMPGDDKIVETVDAKGANTSDFKLAKEDHTVANLLRMKLHTNKYVKFAGYRIPHPTKMDVVFKVQTANPGEANPQVPTPSKVLMAAIDECVADVDEFDRAFESAVQRFESGEGRDDGDDM